MNPPGLPSDPSGNGMEKNTVEKENIGDTAGSSENGSAKSPKKTFGFPKKTFGFPKKDEKGKDDSKDIEDKAARKAKGSKKDKDDKPLVKKRKPVSIKKMYLNFCYSFGIYFDQKPNTELAKSLYQADIELTPGMFISLAVITSSIVSILMFILSLIVFYDVPNSLVYIFSITFLTLGLSLGGFPFALYNKVSDKNLNIMQEIPFAVSYMSVLASGGSSPLEIIRQISQEDYGDVSKEFYKVIYRIDILGEDANSALSHLIQNTSSETLRLICIDVSNAIQAGGGLMAYLELKSKELIGMRREYQKVFIESLSIYGEGYLSGVVVSVVLSILMIVLCTALGIDLKIMTPGQMFTFFVYFALPFINIMFLLLLWMKYSRSVI